MNPSFSTNGWKTAFAAIKSIFGNNDLVTVRQMEEAFYNLAERIKKENKGEEIRIKIEE